MTQRGVARRLVERHGRNSYREAGIRLGNTSAPLYQLLVLATLLSARIGADVLRTVSFVAAAGTRTP